MHRYANLYLNAHNAMLAQKTYDKDKSKADELKSGLCVLRIDPRILARDEVVISNKNAATDGVEFENATQKQFSPRSTGYLTSEISKIMASKGATVPESDRDRQPIRQAEVLVPYQLHPSYIRGVYVANAAGYVKVKAVVRDVLPITQYPSLFFQTKSRRIGVKGHKGEFYYYPRHPRAVSPLANTKYPDLVEDLPTSSDDDDDGMAMEVVDEDPYGDDSYSATSRADE